MDTESAGFRALRDEVERLFGSGSDEAEVAWAMLLAMRSQGGGGAEPGGLRVLRAVVKLGGCDLRSLAHFVEQAQADFRNVLWWAEYNRDMAQWVEEWEGWWEPVPGSPAPDVGGKIEWEIDTEGHSEVDVLLRGLDLAAGGAVDVVDAGSGSVVVSCPVDDRGKGRVAINTSRGEQVPDLRRQEVELRWDGQAVARAVLEPD